MVSVINMQTEQLNLKLEKDLLNEIEIVSDVLHVPKNEWARSVLARQVKKELEEHKKFIARKYINGLIKRNDLIKIFGKKEVKEIDHILSVGKRSFNNAKKLSKFIK
mgnify:CR=1 FL=1